MLEHDKIYLQTCQLTENDPAVIFQWNYPVLEQFVKGVNSCYEPNEVQSYFITTLPGQMTVESLMGDIMATLAKFAGGKNGHTVLAPNNLSQFGNISSVLFDIGSDKWLQLQYNNYIPENSKCFAFLYTVTSNTELTETPCNLVSFSDRRHIFQ